MKPPGRAAAGRAPNRRSAPKSTIASIHVGWTHETTSPSPTPSAAKPAAARSARWRYSAKVIRRALSSTAISWSGVSSARRTIRSQMLRASSIATPLPRRPRPPVSDLASGETMGSATPRDSPLAGRLQAQKLVEADGEAGPPADLLDRQHHPGHEARPVVAVVADGQRLAGGAEQHLLVGDEAPQAHRVHGDAARPQRASGPRDHLLARGVLAPLGRRVGHALRRQHGRAGL